MTQQPAPAPAPTPTPAAGRSRSRRRFDVTTALALALPLLTVGALALVRPEVAAPAATPPQETALTRAVVVCPSGAPEVAVATGNDTEGTVDYLLGDREGSADVVAGGVTTVSGRKGPLVARAEGDLAPGLVAGRFESPLAAAECRPPAPDQWFTGVGSGARHTSTLELVNPDAGPAVVDATLYGVSGVIDAPGLRGVAVPGRGVVRLPIAELVPRRDELALHVTTSRGRVTASLRDRYQQLGTGGAAEDWLRSQAAPATGNLLLGLAPGSGLRSLVLLNPGTDETRARVRLVTGRSVFSPAGLEEVVLAPQSVTRVSLTDLLRGPAGEGALGLVVDSGTPVTATLRTYAGGDLSHAVPGSPITDPTTVLTPTGAKQVVVGGATRAGTVTVTARTADGTVVGEEKIEVVAGRGYVVDVPRRAVVLTVTPRRTTVEGAVLVTDGGAAAVIGLREQVTSGLVGAVRPGLP